MRRKKKEINLFKILSIVLVFIFLLLIPSFIKKFIIIQNITCRSQYGECVGAIYDSFNFPKKDLLYLKKHVEESLLTNYLISGFVVSYKIPNTLDISVVYKKPSFAIVGKDSVYYEIDNNGTVLNKSQLSNLPCIKIEGFSIAMGDRIDGETLYALKLLYKITFMYEILSAELKTDGLYVYLKEGVTAIFPVSGDIDVLAGSLRLIYSRLNDEAIGFRMSDIDEIDLRYKNPIIR